MYSIHVDTCRFLIPTCSGHLMDSIHFAMFMFELTVFVVDVVAAVVYPN